MLEVVEFETMWRVIGIVFVAIALTICTTNVAEISVEKVGTLPDYDEYEDFDEKVAEGAKPNRTFGKDYALISISFVNEKQICGGALIRAEWILTSATCLSE